MILQTDLVRDVVSYYHEQLKLSDTAKDYLHSRGLTDKTIDHFHIGYAPHEPKYAPRFRDRVIFPIYDQQGYPVGWTGRTLVGSHAKYLNTRDSIIFKKNRLLYAYNCAKETIFKTQEAILTEGQMDVVTLHQEGFTNAVATSGTSAFRRKGEVAPIALLLGRYARKVYIVYDEDDAGIAARRAAIVHLTKAGIPNIVIVTLPAKEDPASYILKYGAVKFTEVLHGAG